MQHNRWQMVLRPNRRLAAVTRHMYRVVVTREDSDWLADVPELSGAHTHARNLPSLDRAVRGVIVLAADLPDEAMLGLMIDYYQHTGSRDCGCAPDPDGGDRGEQP